MLEGHTYPFHSLYQKTPRKCVCYQNTVKSWNGSSNCLSERTLKQSYNEMKRMLVCLAEQGLAIIGHYKAGPGRGRHAVFSVQGGQCMHHSSTIGNQCNITSTIINNYWGNNFATSFGCKKQLQKHDAEYHKKRRQCKRSTNASFKKQAMQGIHKCMIF